jgi:hypothetical protein
VAILRSRQSQRTRPVRRYSGRGTSLRVEVNPVNMRDTGEIERAVAGFESPGEESVTGLEGASLRSCHRGRLLALLFYIAPYKESACSEDGAGKKGEPPPHRKNTSHRNNQPKKYWVASLTLIQAIVATSALPVNTSQQKTPRQR